MNFRIDEPGAFLAVSRLMCKTVKDGGGRIAFLSDITLSSHLTHDIDIVVDKPGWNLIPAVLNALSENFSLNLVQLIQYDAGRSIYLVFAQPVSIEGDELGYRYLKVDFIEDADAVGRYGIRTDQLLQHVVEVNGLSRPSPSYELLYLLRKRVVKGRVEADQFARMFELAQCLPMEQELPVSILAVGCRADHYRSLYEALKSGDRHELNRLLGVKRLFGRCRDEIHAPVRSLKRMLSQVARVWHRVLNPVGLCLHIPCNDDEFANIENEIRTRHCIPLRGRIIEFSGHKFSARGLTYYYQILGYLVLVRIDRPVQTQFIDSNVRERCSMAAVTAMLFNFLRERAQRRIHRWWA